MTIALLLAALFQEQVDNMEYKGWADFKPGSSVTFSYGPQKGGQRVTLVSINETEAVVSTEIMSGTKTTPAVERKVPAKIAAADAPKDVKKGEEEIEVAGKSMKCRTAEFDKTLASGKTATIKVWANDEVPGRGVKVETTTSNGKFTMIATEWEKK